jgi:3'-phosphoadenosine 5'-phosphosulfate sulfotransferase (PAPS reductase)/FAD synthetase
MTMIDLNHFDIILLNTSGGKDSQVMLDVVCAMTERRDQMVGVHADLDRVEWGAGSGEWEGRPSARDLAEIQVRHYYGIERFETVKRDGTVRKDGKVLGDLLDQVVERHESNLAKGKDHSPWPNSSARWCTSDQKTSQVKKLVTQLVSEWHEANPDIGRKCRVLNVLGIRADESPKRAKMVPLGPDAMNWTTVNKVRKPHGLREVTRWYPIFEWTEDEVWARIRERDVPHHWAYDAGMPRLSCCFCVFAPKEALVRAAQLNPGLARQYVAIEKRVGHAIKEPVSGPATSMEDVLAEAEATDQPVLAPNWAA